MKFKTLATFLSVMFFIIFAGPISIAKERKAGPLAAAVFPEPVYEFSSVVEGLKVKHDFVVQNRGKAELQIYKVRTG